VRPNRVALVFDVTFELQLQSINVATYDASAPSAVWLKRKKKKNNNNNNNNNKQAGSGRRGALSGQVAARYVRHVRPGELARPSVEARRAALGAEVGWEY